MQIILHQLIKNNIRHLAAILIKNQATHEQNLHQ